MVSAFGSWASRCTVTFSFSGRIKRQSGVIGGHRQHAARAIHQHREFNFLRAAVVEQFVERRFDGAAGKEHVIHQNHGRTVNVGRNRRRHKLLGNGIAADVVAMERDVERADPGGFQLPRDALGQHDATVGDAKQDQVGRGPVAFGNGLGQPCDGGLNGVGPEGLEFGHDHRFWGHERSR